MPANDYDGATNGATLQVPPQTPDLGAPNRRVLVNEFVAGGNLGASLAAYYSSLPLFIDQNTRLYGVDLYERMLTDDQVAPSFRNVVNGVLSEGVTIRPKVDDKKNQLYGDAKKEADRCAAELEDMPRGPDEIMRDLLYAAALGHKLGEQIYRKEGDRLVLDRIKIKPQRTTAFVVDRYSSVVRIASRLPSQPSVWAVNGVLSDAELRKLPLLPRDKFAILSWMPKDEDPRGTSLLECVYLPWFRKMQTCIDYLKFLGQFASPSIIGILGKESYESFLADAYGNPTGTVAISAVQKLLNILLEFKNNYAMALPPDTEVKTLFAGTDGAAFINALDRWDRAIDRGITGQTLATGQAERSSLGSAGPKVHQDTLGSGLHYPRLIAARVMTRDVLRNMVRWNGGDAKAKAVAPVCTLAAVDQQDKGSMLQAYADAFAKGLIKEPQLHAVWEELGLPDVSPAELLQIAQQKAAQGVVQGTPPGKGPKDEPGAKD